MLLVTCPDCQQQIPSDAPACIQCSRPATPPVPPHSRRGPNRLRRSAGGAGWFGLPRPFLAAWAVFGLLLAVSVLFGGSSAVLSELLFALQIASLGAVFLTWPSDAGKNRPPVARGRKNWGRGFAERERQRELEWESLVGFALGVLGLGKLLLAVFDVLG